MGLNIVWTAGCIHSNVNLYLSHFVLDAPNKSAGCQQYVKIQEVSLPVAGCQAITAKFIITRSSLLSQEIFPDPLRGAFMATHKIKR